MMVRMKPDGEIVVSRFFTSENRERREIVKGG